MTAILLLAAVLLVLVLADRAVRRLPMSAALVYLTIVGLYAWRMRRYERDFQARLVAEQVQA